MQEKTVRCFPHLCKKMPVHS